MYFEARALYREQSAEAGFIENLFRQRTADVTDPTYAFCSFGDDKRIAMYYLGPEERSIFLLAGEDEAKATRKALREQFKVRRDSTTYYKVYFAGKDEFITAARDGLRATSDVANSMEYSSTMIIGNTLNRFRTA